MDKITKNTRAGKGGKTIVCPRCMTEEKVFHFSWVSSVCNACGKTVKKTEWFESPAAALGRKGGKVTSEAKTKAARKNASKPRGKWVTAIAYEFKDEAGELHHGVALKAGKLKMHDNPEADHAEMWAIIQECNPWEKGKTVAEWMILAGRSRLI